MSPIRYLTKSRFLLARECPTKLYYAKKEEYLDNSMDDEFLKALAKGGMQVGALARLYYPEGIEIAEREDGPALAHTENELQKENVTLFEAAFRFGRCFVRVDILEKRGTHVKLIEVKSKSYGREDSLLKKSGGVHGDWEKYLYDVAFQKYVLRGARPDLDISSCLMVADKDKVASVDGLYQNLYIVHDDGKPRIQVIDPRHYGEMILTLVEVSPEVEVILSTVQTLEGKSLSLEDYVNRLAEAYVSNTRILDRVHKDCRNCQFRGAAPVVNGLKSGFHECWTAMTTLTHDQLAKPMVFDIWNYREKDKMMDERVLLQSQVVMTSLEEKAEFEPEMNTAARQVLQIRSSRGGRTLTLNRAPLRQAMQNVTYPLHFIDFENTGPAVPFYIGRRPYEMVAFQFSQHTIDEQDKVRHQTQWLNDKPGAFPNFDFVRKLRGALGDRGTIFRYSGHENSVLNAIRRQLLASTEPDRDELVAWIESITSHWDVVIVGDKEKGKKVVGPRNMTDLLEWIKWYYFDPDCNGSNSLKAILPSIINRSARLQEKYSQPIYGSEIFSHNFKAHVWLQRDENGWRNPYELLPRVLGNHSRGELDSMGADAINPDDDLADGGAAMMAYNYMQFPQMSEAERLATIDALHRYCELDTMAMVMLWEGLEDLVGLR